MTDIQRFFCIFGSISCLLLTVLAVGSVIYLIADYYVSKDIIKDLENKYCDLDNNLRGVEITINRLKSEAESNNERTK